MSGVGTASYAGDCADWLSLERKELKLERWDADGFRVGLVADLHMNSEIQFQRAQRAIKMVLDEKPDLFVMGGDYLNYSHEPMLGYIGKVLEPLGEASCPCVSVLGNHDYGCLQPGLVVKAVRRAPIQLLRNQIVEVQGVSVVGLDDATFNFQNYEFFPSEKVSKNCLAVLHEPDYVEEMPGHVSLQISGHTHGGQVCLPFGYAMHTPKGGRRYIAGYFPHANVPLYVTRGVGTVGIDYRLFCRPEVTILTLRSA